MAQLDNVPTADRPRLSVMWRALKALRRPRHSISGRLMFVVLLTTVLALLVAGAGLLVTDLRDSRRAWADDASTDAGISPSVSHPRFPSTIAPPPRAT